mgnify:CR=1 FL=1
MTWKGRRVSIKKAVLVAAAGMGIALASVLAASPASAHHGYGSVGVDASNGTVGVNQVVTAHYDFPNGDYPTCWDPRQGVTFSFSLSNGVNLGTVDATCSGTSTWTGTANWNPTAAGRFTVTATATQPNLGGSGLTLGQGSTTVNVAGAKPAGPTAPATVRNLKVTGVSSNVISLNWDAPTSDGGSPISGYIVKWSGPTSGQIVAGATNANVGTLKSNSTYTFSVSAANAVGWSNWVSVNQMTANGPAPVQQQTLVGPSWAGGGPKVKSGQWKTFNNTSNLDTNAGYKARLSAVASSSVRSVTFRYVGDQVQVRAVLRPGASSGSFTLVESSPAVPGFTAMSVTRAIKVVR